MISLVKVLEELGLEGVDARRDAILTRLIASATATVGREIGRFLDVPTETTIVRRGGATTIVLPDDPTDAEITVATRAFPTDPWATTSTDDYVVEGRNVRHAGRWLAGRASVQITYTRGYAVDAGPPELRELVLDLVTGKWTGAQGDALLKSEKIGDYSYTNFTQQELDAGTFGNWESFVRSWRRQLA